MSACRVFSDISSGLHQEGPKDLTFLLLLMEDGQMGMVFNLIGKIQEIWFLKDVSANRGGMCIGGNLIFQDRPGLKDDQDHNGHQVS